MKRLLVIGYGNTLRGDDGAGVRAAEQVRHRLRGVDVLTFHELQPDLAETISDRPAVIFIDAGVDLTQIVCSRIDASTHTEALRTHLLTPPQLLALCRTLYGDAPQHAYLIGIPASEFDFSESLSPRTASFLEPVISQVKALCRRPGLRSTTPQGPGETV